MNRDVRRAMLGVVRALIVLIFCASAPVFVSAEQGGAMVRPDPLSLGLKIGGQGTVTLLVENVQDLYGLEIHLTFDPQIVEVLDADPAQVGVQAQIADWLKGGFIAVNRADNALGKLDFAATLLSPASPASGSKAFVTVTFQAKGQGTAPLTIDQAILATRDAAVIETQVQNGMIGVSVQGLAPKPAAASASGSKGPASKLLLVVSISGTAVLLALGVLAYAIISRRRRSA